MADRHGELEEREFGRRGFLGALGAAAGGDEATSANVRNWMECVRSRKTPNASIEAGYSHSVALCMTIAAMHSGQRVAFDDAK